MGKKVKILAQDPILSKNFKYDKRHKARALEKAQSEAERAEEMQKKKELSEVERKVDEQIEALAHSVAKNTASLKIGKLKQKIFVGQRPEQKESAKSLKIAELIVSPSEQVDAYSHHYDIVALESIILKEKKMTLKQKIEQKTKEEIKGMFGNQQAEGPSEDAEEEGSARVEQVFNLLPEQKKQHDIKFKGEVYSASKLFENHKQTLSSSPIERENSSLESADVFIKGYFDHLFIENREEQTIENFRKIVIQHSAQHMQKCLESEKGRGFTNCKLLILTPFVGDACAIFEAIEEQYEGFEVLNKEKLEELEDDCDFFRIGLKIIRKKQQLSYFSSFDHSDIIVASPVGLKSIIGSQGDEKRENSFISSVQILYIDRASVLMMQNWSHVTEILKNMNYMPRYESLKNSIDSIRDCFLQLKGRLYRQNIVFSEYNFPQLNALKHTHFHNLQGSITSRPNYKRILTLGEVEQQFFKIELKTAREDLQVRFQYFKRKFWDDLHNKESNTKIVLFASSYFEYVKLKAFLEKVNASAQCICEHTSANKVQSRLAKFNSDQFRILLTTERAYYFEVCKVKKFHHLYFYSLPKNSFIYKEMVSSITQSETQRASIISIYTRFDALCLERLVGSGKASEMVREYCSNVSFIL